jgi:hypothetical protein
MERSEVATVSPERIEFMDDGKEARGHTEAAWGVLIKRGAGNERVEGNWDEHERRKQ